MKEIVKNHLVKKIKNHEVVHNSYILFYNLKGNLSLTVFDEVFSVGKGDCVVINPNDEYKVIGEDVLLYIVEIDAKELYKLLGYKKKYILCNTLKENGENHQKLRKLLDMIITNKFDAGYNKLYEQKYIYDMLTLLIGEFSNNSYTFDEENSRKSDIEAYILSQYQDDISLDEISQYFNLTPQYFAKFFKENFGLTFLNYLNSVRAEYACYDLINSNRTVLKIALDNGFPNVTSFTNFFNKKYKITPSEYRKRFKGKNTDDSDISLYEITDNIQFDEDEINGFVHNVVVNNVKDVNLLKRYWSMICNFGNISRLNDINVEMQISTLQDEIGFEYARVTLDTLDDMSSDYMVEERAVDILLKAKLNVYISIDYRSICGVGKLEYLQGFIYHCINRYGVDNVASWAFELVYNSDYTKQKAISYNNVYNRIVSLLKKLGVNHNLAGPAILLDETGDNLKMFLKYNRTLEILTLSIAPFSVGKIDGSFIVNRTTDSEYIIKQYRLALSVVEKYKNIRKVYISSWNDSLNTVDAINDTCYRAASIVKNIIHGYGVLENLPINYPLDTVNAEKKQNRILSGLPGILTENGIKKPSFYAYKFLKNLDRNLLYKDSHVFVTNDKTKYFQIICHNIRKLNYKYYLYEREGVEKLDVHSFYDDEDSMIISFTINGAENGKYVLKEKLVNEKQGSVFDVYNNMNIKSTSFFGPTEMEYLRAMSQPSITSQIIEVTNGTVTFNCKIEPNEIKHIHLIYSH